MNGYPSHNNQKESRAKYYDALDLAHTTLNYAPILDLVADLELESERLWLSVLE